MIIVGGFCRFGGDCSIGGIGGLVGLFGIVLVRLLVGVVGVFGLFALWSIINTYIISGSSTPLVI